MTHADDDGGVGLPTTPQAGPASQVQSVVPKDHFTWLRAVREQVDDNGLSRMHRLVACMIATDYFIEARQATITNSRLASYCGYTDEKSIRSIVTDLVRLGWLDRTPGGMRKGTLARDPSVYRLRIPAHVVEKMKEKKDDRNSGDRSTEAPNPPRAVRPKPAAPKTTRPPVTAEDAAAVAAVVRQLLVIQVRYDLISRFDQEGEYWLAMARSIRPRLDEGWDVEGLLRAAMDDKVWGRIPPAEGIRKSVTQFIAGRVQRLRSISDWQRLQAEALAEADPVAAKEARRMALQAEQDDLTRRLDALPEGELERIITGLPAKTQAAYQSHGMADMSVQILLRSALRRLDAVA